MKKILIVVGAVFLIGILLVAVPLSGRFDKIQYEKRLEMDALVAAGREDGLRAESGGIVTLVSPMNADRISRSLTPSEAKRERFVSVEDPEIVLTYANGDVVSLKADPKKEDRALVQLQYEGKKITFKGQVYRNRTFPKDAFVPARSAMTCCADDIAKIGFICHYKKAADFKTDSWVKVTVEVKPEFSKRQQGVVPMLYADSVEPCEPPKEEVVYFS